MRWQVSGRLSAYKLMDNLQNLRENFHADVKFVLF